MAEWGVTVLEATGEVDGGGVWASRTFRTREAGKSSLYRHEVRRAAIEARPGGGGGGRRRRAGGGARRLRRSERDRPPTSADPTARPCDRLGLRLHDDSGPPYPRRRGPPGRARPYWGDRVPSLRRPPRGHAARPARRDPRAEAWRDLPRDGRRSRLDQPPEAPRPLQAARDVRARRRRIPARRRGAARAAACAAVRPADVPRDRLRGAPRCRLPALRLLQRRDEHRTSAEDCSTPTATRAPAGRASSCSWAASTSSRTAST